MVPRQLSAGRLAPEPGTDVTAALRVEHFDEVAEAMRPLVPVIDEALDVFERFRTMDELLAFAEGKTARGHEREGVVFKSTEAPYVSFKVVSNRYLLKNG